MSGVKRSGGGRDVIFPIIAPDIGRFFNYLICRVWVKGSGFSNFSRVYLNDFPNSNPNPYRVRKVLENLECNGI